MEEYVGLDVSMEETSVCVMDAAGEIVWEGKAATVNWSWLVGQVGSGFKVYSGC